MKDARFKYYISKDGKVLIRVKGNLTEARYVRNFDNWDRQSLHYYRDSWAYDDYKEITEEEVILML